MTKFNPEGKKVLTYGECLRPACEEIETVEDAAQYFRDYVRFIQDAIDEENGTAGGVNKNGNTAEEIAKINIGYFAGYYSNDTAARVNKLFDTTHPIFGSILAKTPQQALKAGFKAGKEEL